MISGSVRVFAPLFGVAVLAGIVAALAPALPIVSAGAQDLVALVLALVPLLAGLHAASLGEAKGRVLIGALLASIAALVALRFVEAGVVAVPIQVLALLVAGHVVGSAIGSRVAYAGHVLPASAVAAAADVLSLLSPEGPSNAIVKDERSLATFAIAAAVPGTSAITFVLGVGDIVFMALLLAVAKRFSSRGAGPAPLGDFAPHPQVEIAALRVTAACAIALVLAFASSALLARPIPALVPIAVVANLMVPAFRAVPKKDRRAAVFALVLAGGLVAVALVRAVTAGT